MGNQSKGAITYIACKTNGILFVSESGWYFFFLFSFCFSPSEFFIRGFFVVVVVVVLLVVGRYGRRGVLIIFAPKSKVEGLFFNALYVFHPSRNCCVGFAMCYFDK